MKGRGCSSIMLIEEFDKNRHDSTAVSELLAMAVGLPTPKKLANLMDNFYSSEDRRIFLTLDDEKPIGMLGIDFTNHSHGVITHLATAPERRKQGIAVSLINHVARKLKLKDIVAETDQDAVEFYRVIGFKTEEIESRWPGVKRFKFSKQLMAEVN